MNNVVRAISRPSEVDRLIADLDSADPVRADASVARLRVLGTHALPRLEKVIAASHAPRVRACAMSALEGLDDPHVPEIALRALTDADADVVAAALGVLRGWVQRETGTRLFEAITAIAVDRNRDARIRVAALEALSDLPERLVRPIRQQAPTPEAAGPPVDNPAAARGGSRLTEQKPPSPRCTTPSRRFVIAKHGRKRAGAARSGSRRAAPFMRTWRTAAAGWLCTTPARPSAARSLRCRPVFSKPSHASAMPAAWSRSHVPGRQHMSRAGAPGLRRPLGRSSAARNSEDATPW